MTVKDQLKRLLGNQVAPIEILGETFHAKAMTVAEFIDFDAWVKAGDGPDAVAKMACYYLCDDKGNRVYRQDDLPEVMALFPLTVLTKLAQEFNDMNKFTTEGVVDLEKKLCPVP